MQSSSSFVVSIAAMVIFAVLVHVLSAPKRAARQAMWDYVAVELGLNYKPRGFFDAAGLTGSVDGVPVQVTEASKGKERVTRFEVGGPGYPLPAIGLKGEDTSMVNKLFRVPDLETGDAEFDRIVFLDGEPILLRAVLNAEVRRATLAAIIYREAAFADGLAIAQVPSDGCRSEVLLATARDLIAAVKALAKAGKSAADAPAALGDMARFDPKPGVRVRCFEVLATEFARDPRTREVAEAMPEFTAPATELLRLRLCGDALARPGLSAMARENLPLELRGEALRALVKRFGYADNREVVLEALGAPSVVDRLAAVALIAAAQDVEQVPRLASLMLREDETGAVGYAQALGQLGDARAEADLSRLLTHDSDAVNCAAAVALGLLGTVASVEPLLPLTEGLLRAGPVKEAARDAVRRIQSRLGAVEGGRVSLAEDVSGRLSVVAGAAEDAGAGAVSLAESRRS